MRAYVNGKDAPISVRFGLTADHAPSDRVVIRAIKRFGMPDTVLAFISVPSARLVLCRTAFTPRIEKRLPA